MPPLAILQPRPTLSGAATALFIALIVTWPPVLWAYLNYGVQWDMALWYLNWRTPAHSVFLAIERANLLALSFSVACSVLLVHRSQNLRVSVLCLLLVSTTTLLSNGAVVRHAGMALGLASFNCITRDPFTCQLNRFGRMYDLDAVEALGEADLKAYGKYIGLREAQGIGRPNLSGGLIFGLEQQQRRLSAWTDVGGRDLREALGATP